MTNDSSLERTLAYVFHVIDALYYSVVNVLPGLSPGEERQATCIPSPLDNRSGCKSSGWNFRPSIGQRTKRPDILSGRELCDT